MVRTGRSAALAVTALAVSAAVLTGTRIVPLQTASALPVNPAGGRTGSTAAAPAPQTAAPAPQAQTPVVAAVESKSAELRDEPSGLEAVDARTAGRRTPTPVSKAAKVSAYKAYRAEIAAAALQGTGPWKTAKVSWYGPGFYGNTMAGGGTLRPTSMVVAHRSLPFGTKIEFSYKGKTCVAVVRDRGPYIAGRLFDLGPGTAKALGFSGVGSVNYRIVK